jgi:hypothetical protein
MFAKGSKPKNADYAKGGDVLGRTRDFLKVPDQFTDGRLPPNDEGHADDPEQDYDKTGSGGKLSKVSGDKSLKTVKPRT